MLVLVLVSGMTTWIRDGLQAPLVTKEQPQPADVIIVLGSGTQLQGDHVPPQAKQRVRQAIALWRNGQAGRVILSGGRDDNTKLVEADTMADFASALGLPNNVILEERISKNTFQNAIFSLDLMKENGWRTAIVVTSPYHTWRACQIFRKQKADVHCVAAPYSLFPANSFLDHLNDTISVVREYGAIVYNWVKGEL